MVDEAITIHIEVDGGGMDNKTTLTGLRNLSNNNFGLLTFRLFLIMAKIFLQRWLM